VTARLRLGGALTERRVGGVDLETPRDAAAVPAASFE